MPKKKMGGIQLKKRGFDVYVLEVILSNMWQALLHGIAGLIGAQGADVAGAVRGCGGSGGAANKGVTCVRAASVSVTGGGAASGGVTCGGRPVGA